MFEAAIRAPDLYKVNRGVLNTDSPAPNTGIKLVTDPHVDEDQLPGDYLDRLIRAAKEANKTAPVFNGYGSPGFDIHRRGEEYYDNLIRAAGFEYAIQPKKVEGYTEDDYKPRVVEQSDAGLETTRTLSQLRYWLTEEEKAQQAELDKIDGNTEVIRPPLYYTMKELHARYMEGMEILHLNNIPTIMFKSITKDPAVSKRAIDLLEEKGWITFFTDGTIVAYPKPEEVVKETAEQTASASAEATYESIRGVVNELRPYMYWGIGIAEGAAQPDMVAKPSVIINSNDSVEEDPRKRRRYSDGGSTATIAARRAETHLESLVRERVLGNLGIDENYYPDETSLRLAIAQTYLAVNPELHEQFSQEDLAQNREAVEQLIGLASLEANQQLNNEVFIDGEITAYSMFDPRGNMPEDRQKITSKKMQYMQNTRSEILHAIISLSLSDYNQVRGRVWYPKKGIFPELEIENTEEEALMADQAKTKKNVSGLQSIEEDLDVVIDGEKSSLFRQHANEEVDIHSLVTELARMRTAQRVLQMYMRARYGDIRSYTRRNTDKNDAMPYSVYAESARFLVPNLFEKLARAGYKRIPDRKQFDLFLEAVVSNMNIMSADTYGLHYKVWVLKHMRGAVARVFNGFLQDSTKIPEHQIAQAERLCDAWSSIGKGTVLITDDVLRLVTL